MKVPFLYKLMFTLELSAAQLTFVSVLFVTENEGDAVNVIVVVFLLIV